MCPTLCAGLSFLCPTWFCAQALSFLCPTWFCTSFALSFLWLAQNEWFCSRFLHLLQRQNNFWCPACSANTQANAQSCRSFVACTEITCFWLLCSWFCMFCRQNHFCCSACSAIPEPKCTQFLSLLWLAQKSQKSQDSILLMISGCSAGKTTFCFWNLANLGHFFHGKSLYFQVEIWQNFAQKKNIYISCQHGSYTHYSVHLLRPNAKQNGLRKKKLHHNWIWTWQSDGIG